MSGHNVREEIADTNPMATSTTDAELLCCRNIYGEIADVVETANNKTRKLVPPSAAGQMIHINVTLSTNSHVLTIPAPTGTTFDGVNATLTFTRAAATTQLWVTLISFYIDVSGTKTLSWRVLGKGPGVTLTT